MHVLVTGSLGKVGRAAVTVLRGAGHTVTGADLHHAVVDGARTMACDCTDYGEVASLMMGVDTHPRPDAVLHLAGIPAPGMSPDATIFATNTNSTYNVFTAAARAGIRKIVWASSETLLGLPFTEPPAYVPLDEEHPDRPEWSYSLSKKVGETMADELVRWYKGMAIVSLRISNVYAPEDYGQRAAIERQPAMRRGNLWSYVDARDVGEACRLALEADIQGHEAMIIAAADTVVSRPSAELMATYFPDVPIRATLNGCQSLESSAKAEEMIGYQPRHSWRDQ